MAHFYSNTRQRSGKARIIATCAVLGGSALAIVTGFGSYAGGERTSELQVMHREYDKGLAEPGQYAEERQRAEQRYTQSVTAFKTNLEILKAVPNNDIAKQFVAARTFAVSVGGVQEAHDRLQTIDKRWDQRLIGCERATGTWNYASSNLFRIRCRGAMGQPLQPQDEAAMGRMSSIGQQYYAVRNPVIQFFGYKPGALEF
jgi:hypothetical protein